MLSRTRGHTASGTARTASWGGSREGCAWSPSAQHGTDTEQAFPECMNDLDRHHAAHLFLLTFPNQFLQVDPDGHSPEQSWEGRGRRGRGGKNGKERQAGTWTFTYYFCLGKGVLLSRRRNFVVFY